MFRKFLRLSLISILSLSATARAGDCFVQGVVTDPGGGPVKNAEIRVEPRNGGKLLAATRTDAIGRYTIAHLPPGTYRVTLLVEGAVFASINNIPAKVNEPTELNFKLRATSASQKTSGAAQTKHLVWVPAKSRSRTDGRWIEVDNESAPAAGAVNSATAGGKQLQQLPNPGVGPSQDQWARNWISSTH
jgi:hypothetical protein